MRIVSGGSKEGSAGEAQAFTKELAAAAKKKESKYASNWWRQFVACYGREILSITRNPADVAGRTLTFTWVGLLMGLLYYR